MADVQHNALTDPNLHEPKGVAAAAADKIYVTDGAGSGAFHTTADITRTGIYDYNDLTTASTPITLTPTGTYIDMTNDGAGTSTLLTYKLPDVANPWNVSTDRFDFTDFALGDWVDVRLDLTVTTSAANTLIETGIELGLGGTAYTLNVDASEFKTAGTYNIVRYVGLYIGDTNTKDNPGKIKMKSDAGTATVQVNGWYIKAGKRGLVT